MTEYRTVSFMFPTTELLGAVPNGVHIRTIDFTQSVPGLAEHMDGWEVINSQMMPAGDFTYLVFFLRTAVPDAGTISS